VAVFPELSHVAVVGDDRGAVIAVKPAALVILQVKVVAFDRGKISAIEVPVSKAQDRLCFPVDRVVCKRAAAFIGDLVSNIKLWLYIGGD